MKGKRAFTMVELLVVMVIIAILAALVLPALARTRLKVHGTSCLGNLRQWGIALRLFTANHDELLPPEGFATPTLPGHFKSGWYVQLPLEIHIPPYLTMPWRTNPAAEFGHSIWTCPANSRRSNGHLLFHYCLNEHVDGVGDTNIPVLSYTVRNPSRVIYLFDSKNQPAVGGWTFAHTNLHDRGAQFLFLDGHTERFGNSAFWDFRAKKAITNNPELMWRP